MRKAISIGSILRWCFGHRYRAPAVIGGCAVASNWLATIRGRAGFAADRVLFDVTGGGAFTNIKPSTGALPVWWRQRTGLDRGRRHRIRLHGYWTAKFEYLYASFQSANCNSGSCSVGNAVVPGLAPATVSFNENIVRAGVNYKFGRKARRPVCAGRRAERRLSTARRNSPCCCFFALFRGLRKHCTSAQSRSVVSV